MPNTPTYTETFSSPWWAPSVWILRFALVFAALVLLSVAFVPIKITDTVLKPLFFFCLPVLFVTSLIKATKAPGSISVTSDGFTLTEEKNAEFFIAKDIQFVGRASLQETRRGRYRADFVDETGESRSIPCNVRPRNLSWSTFYRGGIVVLHRKTSVAIYLPTKHPEELYSALTAIRKSR